MNGVALAVETKRTSTKGTLSNLSTDKALLLIEFLSTEPEPVRIQYISTQTGLNISTVYRYLSSLERLGYVKQDMDTGKYSLTMKICSVAHNVASNNSIIRIASPYLRKLVDIFGASVCLSVERDMQVVYVDTCDSKDQLLKSFAYIGRTAPMHCTGTGKLFLTNYDNEHLERYFETKDLTRLTPHTITSPDVLRQELQKVRIKGFAVDAEECELGASCIAVPIRDYTGLVVAGISVTGAVNFMTLRMVEDKLPFLLEAGQTISRQMGYQK